MRKVGFHLLHHPSYERIIPLIQKVKPAVIKAVSDGDYLPRLADSLKGALDYEPVFVQRNWFENRGAGHPNFYQGYTVDQYTGAVLSTLNATAGRDNFFWESYNETGIDPAYMAFETARTWRFKEAFGVRSLVLNMGVGWSAPGHVDMAKQAGLLEALRQTGGAWGEHGYGSVLGLQMYHGPNNQAVNADGSLGRPPKEMAFDKTIYPDTVASWLAFRSSMSHQNLVSVGYGDIPIIISEFGFDDAGFHSYRHYTGGAAVSAWRECVPYWQKLGYLDRKSPAEFYGEQLAWAEAQFSVYPWLMGATVFTVGSDPASRWALYDVLDTPVFDHFIAALSDKPPIPNEPPSVPEPPDLPPLDGCYVTPTSGRVNIRVGATTDAEIVGMLEHGEAVKALAVYYEDAGRMWFRTVVGYIASWVVTVSDGCDDLPDETHNGDQIMVKPIGLVYRDHEELELEVSARAYGANIFTCLGESRYAAAAKVSDFIARIWIQFDNNEKNRGLPDYGNADTFISKVGGMSVVDIVDKVLLEATPIKNYISYAAHHYISGHSDKHPEIPTGETRVFENPTYSEESIIELLNGDEVPQGDLGTYFAVQALALERLHVAVDPASRQTVERDLRGAVVNRNIAHDPDREAFWDLAVNRGLLKAVADYDGVIQLKRKVTGRIADYRERDVFPFVDLMTLTGLGYGNVKVVLQVEYIGGWQEQGFTPEMVATDLFLLAKTAANYDHLEVVFFLRQSAPSGNWGDKHDVRGTVEALYLDYLHDPSSAPDVDWQASPDDPPDDPPDVPPPPDDDDDDPPTDPSPPEMPTLDVWLDYLKVQRDRAQLEVERLEQLIGKYTVAANSGAK